MGLKNAMTGPDGLVSYSKALPAFILGIVFAFWIAFVTGYLFTKLPDVPWESVSGYFNWALTIFLPAVAMYLFTKWRQTTGGNVGGSSITTETTRTESKEIKTNGSANGGNASSGGPANL